MSYLEFLNVLQPFVDKDFAAFQRRLISTPRKILGVRTPILRRLAKGYNGDLYQLFAYPNEYYETVFIKLTVVSRLPYNQFIVWLPKCVELIDNWALCDSFKCNAVKKHLPEFLPILDKLFSDGQEFYQRYALVMLLYYYVDESYLPTIKEFILRANTKYYYVYMAIAWLTAEVLIKYYDEGLLLLKALKNDVKTHNKAIQKALESFRLTKEQKGYLRSLKIK